MAATHDSPIFGPLAALPRGPHDLSPEQVAASQRGRLLAAITLLVAQRGYASATITEIARRAGVSPNVFYRHFHDKEECFLAAYELFAETLLARMGAQVAATEWHEFVSGTLDAYLRSLDAEPDCARAFLVEINGAGPVARRRRRETFAAFAAVIKERHEQIRRRDPRLGPLPDSAYLGLAHGVRELACDAIESGEPRRLTALAPDIVRWITASVAGAAA